MKAKIKKAEIGREGQVTITVVIMDNKFEWEKQYDYYTTEIISFASLKQRIENEVKEDLQLKDNVLSEVESKIGQPFDLILDND